MAKEMPILGTWCNGCKKICLEVHAGICPNCTKIAKETAIGNDNQTITIYFQDGEKTIYEGISKWEYTERLLLLSKPKGPYHTITNVFNINNVASMEIDYATKQT